MIISKQIASRIDASLLTGVDDITDKAKLTEKKSEIQVQLMKDLLDKNRDLIEQLLQRLNENKTTNSQIIKDLQKLIELAENQRKEISHLRKLEPQILELKNTNAELEVTQSDMPAKLAELQVAMAELSSENAKLSSANEMSEKKIDQMVDALPGIRTALTIPAAAESAAADVPAGVRTEADTAIKSLVGQIEEGDPDT